MSDPAVRYDRVGARRARGPQRRFAEATEDTSARHFDAVIAKREEPR
jgi:hypothetical protein